MHDGKREFITTLEAVSAGGRVLPPLALYKGAAQHRGWHEYLALEDDVTVFSFSPKGWTNQTPGVKYLRLIFNPMTEHLCQGTESRLRIVDGHKSHLSPEFMSFCSDHRIRLFCIPPHTTHLLQQLEVVLF